MNRILFIFPPLAKNSSELYFRTKQFYQILQKTNQVEILSSIHKRGESWTKAPFLFRIIIFIFSFPIYLIRIYRSDILLIFPSNFWYFWVVIGSLLRKKLVLDHYVTAIYPSEDIKLPKFIKVFLVFLDKIIYTKFDIVFTHTKTMQKLLSDFYKIPKEKIIVIYSVVDTKLFNSQKVPKKIKNQIKETWKIPYDVKVAFYHGTYHPFHGVDVIEKAAKLLIKRKDIIFILLGWGAKKAPHDNIIYIPYQPYEKLPQFLSIADVWLGRFSKEERGQRAASSCMLQAMAMAKPIVTEDSPENRFILENGKAGVLIRPESPSILANTLGGLLRDPEKMRRLGQNGREIIIKNFSIEKMEKELNRAFK